MDAFNELRHGSVPMIKERGRSRGKLHGGDAGVVGSGDGKDEGYKGKVYTTRLNRKES